jgi:pyrimidine operon attenuation protein/uracil phosphoribosyltransferase
MSRETVLLDAVAIQRSLVRMAHEIHEANHTRWADVIIVGMRARGDILAKRMADFLKRDAGVGVPMGSLDITLYRDDVGTKAKLPGPTVIPGSVNGKIVVIVDDVLFTGRSIRAAMDALMDYGRPAAIRLAVLVDRGHRELPIRPDHVGKNIPTAPGSNIKVEVVEVDGRDQVVLEEAN